MLTSVHRWWVVIGVQTTLSPLKSSIGLTLQYVTIEIDFSTCDKCSLVVHGYQQSTQTLFVNQFLLLRGTSSISMRNNIAGSVTIKSYTYSDYVGYLTLDVGHYSVLGAICSANIKALTTSSWLTNAISGYMFKIPTKDGMFTNYVGGFFCSEIVDVPNTDDLNNYTNCKKAYKWDANDYPINAPSDGCTMYVLKTNWGCLQIAIRYHASATIYVRNCFIGSWGAWKQIC